MNIHGKNNYHTGPLGEHVLAFDTLLPTGESVTCTPHRNPELFYSLISGAGLLGVFTAITLQLKRIHSGDLDVEAWAAPSLDAMLAGMEPVKDEADYLVGWVDGTKRGRGLGRGQIHRASYLPPGADPRPARTLSVDYQVLPNSLFGLVPKSILPKLMRLGLNDIGVAFVNSAKYAAARRLSHRHRYRQSLVAFNFLLDYIPNWQYGYGPRGLLQYQSFIPRAAAADTFKGILALTQQRGLPSYLGVIKRHRPDRFLLSHAVDGYSLALDFPAPATARGQARTTALAHAMDQLVLEAGGRFYFAKDSLLTPEAARRYLGEDTLARFRALKARCDPHDLLQTDLYRRVLAPARPAATPAAPRPERVALPVTVPAEPPALAGRGNGHSR
jgi:FAD/FMN-containing dehydrogenase